MDVRYSSEEAVAKARRWTQVNTICLHMGFNVMSLTIPMTQRISLLQLCTGLKAAEAAALLATFSSGVGVVEFALNPIAGKLSDAYGRLYFLFQSPTISAVLKLLVFVHPSKTTIGLERCVSGASTTIGGSTSCRSAISDVIANPEERAEAFAQLGTATGIGLVLGPMLGTWASGSSGHPRFAYAIGAVMSTLQLIISFLALKEPLAMEKRVQMPSGRELARALNPFGFLDLYGHGPVLSKLVSGAALQFFCEGKAIADLNGYYMLNEAKFTDARRALYNSLWGFVMVIGGRAGAATIGQFGLRGHTTFQNLSTALGFVLTGATTLPAMIFAALPVLTFAMERGAGVQSLAVSASEDAGMGKGEFSAKFANLRAVAVALAPIFYAKIYSLGVRLRIPGLPYFAGAAIVLIAEALLRRTSRKQVKVEHTSSISSVASTTTGTTTPASSGACVSPPP